MKISRIGTLFASNVDAVLQARQAEEQRDAQSREQAPATGRPSEDAVVYSRALMANRPPPPPVNDARSARLEKLKEQIAKGNYRPESDKVAVAVLKELS